MFWVDPSKQPPTDKFILVRYKDTNLELNESPYQISFGQDTQRLIDSNHIAWWCEITPPMPVRNVFPTAESLENHLNQVGIKVESQKALLTEHNVITQQLLSMQHMGVLSEVVGDSLVQRATAIFQKLTDESKDSARAFIHSWHNNHQDS